MTPPPPPAPPAKKRGLGRGLDALLGTLAAAEAPAAGAAPANPAPAGLEPSTVSPAPAGPAPAGAADATVRELPLNRLQAGRHQPRRTFAPEALEELASSIRAQGVIQPIVVRPLLDRPGRYEIVAGERRWRASAQAGLETIPAIVRPMTERAAMAVALVENIQRADLNALEEASALSRLVTEAHLTHEQVAQAVGRSRASITNLLRLLELAPEVQAMLGEGAISAGHARAIHSLGPAEQAELARRVVAEHWSVRQTEAAVQALAAADEPPGEPADAAPGDAADDARDAAAERARRWRPLAERVGRSLGLPVRFQPAAGGGDEGRMVVSYRTRAELDALLARFGQKQDT